MWDFPCTFLKLVTGADDLSEYEQSPGTRRYFCSRCGSQIYVLLDSEPDLIRPRIGGINGNVNVEITAHVWIVSKANWYKITDDLPQYHKGADDEKVKNF